MKLWTTNGFLRIGNRCSSGTFRVTFSSLSSTYVSELLRYFKFKIYIFVKKAKIIVLFVLLFHECSDCTWWLQGIEGSFVVHFISGHESESRLLSAILHLVPFFPFLGVIHTYVSLNNFRIVVKKIVTTTRVGNEFQFLDEMKKRSKISLRKSCQAPTFDFLGESLFFLLGPIKIKHKKMWNWLCKKRQTIKLKQVRCVWNERKKKR